MILAYTPTKVRNLAKFEAPDPWHENQRARFALDQYFNGGVVPAYAAFEEESKPHQYVIRSEFDRDYRVLPDSLADLWRTKKVTAEQLPELLKDLEPSLKRSDYIRLLTMTPRQRRIRSYAAPVYGVFLLLLGIPFLSDKSSITGPVMIAIGVLAIVLPLVIIRMMNARRAQQSNRALSLSAAIRSRTASPAAQSRSKQPGVA